MAAARAPRVGLFAYAACLVVELLLALWSRQIMAAVRAGETFSHVEKQLDLIGYGYTALGVGAVVALLAVARAPEARLVSRVATGAAVAAGLGVALEVGQRALIAVLSSGSGGFERMDRFLLIFGTGMVLADTVARALGVVIAVRAGRAVASRATVGVGVAAFVVLGLDVAMYVAERSLGEGGHGSRAPASETLATAQTVAYYVATLLVAGTAVLAGRSLSRLPQPDVAVSGEAPGQEALSPRWRAAADGIGLYLGGAAARVVCALLGYAVMAGGSSGTGTPDLRTMHDSFFVIAVLSGAASLTMLAGVWRITRAPPDSGGTGPAMVTLCLMIFGLTLDLVTTSITLDALGGSLSAAFFAMDAMPLLASAAALFGVGAGVALLRSFANMAHTLGVEELSDRAKTATALLVIAGGVAGLTMLGLKHMPVELLGLIAVVVLPLAIAALVQFLRVAVPLGRVIRSRTGYSERSA